jgi:hypothetical protein
MRKSVQIVVAAAAAVGTAACGDVLKVENKQSADVERVFAQAATIEQTLGSGYQQCRNSLHTTTGNAINIQMATMSLESYSQLNNFNMGPRGAIPRSPILNNRTSSSVFTEFSSLSRQSRTLANALAALDRLKESGQTLGTAAQDLRARAWGFFVVGCNLGYLAMTYDSAGIVSHKMPSDSVPGLSGYKEVMTATLQLLDSALAIANNAASAGTGGFPTLAAWMSGTVLQRDQFIQLVRSYKARFRAGNARTPAERAAVDWNAVIADAEAGIKADIMVNVGGSTGWNIGFEGNQMHVDAAWHQISPMYWGMADVSGGYDNWLSRSMTEKPYFLIVTPDLRWPQGTTRAAQQAASPVPGNYLSRPYIANRTLQDTPGDAWGTSFYNHQRYKYIQANSQTGSFPEFLKAEVDLLAAEGYIRTGNIGAAAAKIDITRVGRGGLPALAGVVTSATQVVPGGASCVPRVPAAPSFTSAACGTIMEAMKYEKRTELAFETYGAWFLDSRGWGDLVQGTAVHYPVPFQELDARQHAFYDVGGGGIFSAARGTYGF